MRQQITVTKDTTKNNKRTVYTKEDVRYRLQKKFKYLDTKIVPRIKYYIPKDTGMTLLSFKRYNRKVGQDEFDLFYKTINWNNNPKYFGKGRYNYKRSLVKRNRPKYMWHYRGFMSATQKERMSLLED